jgi:hypothetical protein
MTTYDSSIILAVAQLEKSIFYTMAIILHIKIFVEGLLGWVWGMVFLGGQIPPIWSLIPMTH